MTIDVYIRNIHIHLLDHLSNYIEIHPQLQEIFSQLTFTHGLGWNGFFPEV